MDILLFNINLNKINKDQLYKTDKGIYLSGAIIITGQLDKYGNAAFITQDIKDKPEGEKNPIIGNAKLAESVVKKIDETDKENLGF
jgi:uncharacterized protein YukJ